jgi:hypothetical protein
VLPESEVRIISALILNELWAKGRFKAFSLFSWAARTIINYNFVGGDLVGKLQNQTRSATVLIHHDELVAVQQRIEHLNMGRRVQQLLLYSLGMREPANVDEKAMRVNLHLMRQLHAKGMSPAIWRHTRKDGDLSASRCNLMTNSKMRRLLFDSQCSRLVRDRARVVQEGTVSTQTPSVDVMDAMCQTQDVSHRVSMLEDQAVLVDTIVKGLQRPLFGVAKFIVEARAFLLFAAERCRALLMQPAPQRVRLLKAALALAGVGLSLRLLWLYLELYLPFMSAITHVDNVGEELPMIDQAFYKALEDADLDQLLDGGEDGDGEALLNLEL